MTFFDFLKREGLSLELVVEFMECLPLATNLVESGKLGVPEYLEILTSKTSPSQEFIALILEKDTSAQKAFLKVLLDRQPYLCHRDRRTVEKVFRQGGNFTKTVFALSSSLLKEMDVKRLCLNNSITQIITPFHNHSFYGCVFTK